MRTRIFIDGQLVADEDVPPGKVLTLRENGQRFEARAGEDLRLRSEPALDSFPDLEGPTAFTGLFAPSKIAADIRAAMPWNWSRG